MQLNRRAVLALVAAIPVTLVISPANAAPPIYVKRGLAIRGYDPVAYFTQSAPVRGEKDFSYEWNGAKWRFASAANRDLFAANPESYAPQYGGYCAYAVSQGYTAKTVPEAWTVYEGKLYLNFSLNVRSLWRQDIPGYIAKADANWPGVLA
jgi:YHS domain-containing protein